MLMSNQLDAGKHAKVIIECLPPSSWWWWVTKNQGILMILMGSKIKCLPKQGNLVKFIGGLPHQGTVLKLQEAKEIFLPPSEHWGWVVKGALCIEHDCMLKIYVV